MKKIYYIVWIGFFILSGCKSQKKEVFRLINDSFLNIADTTTYSYGEFFPSPDKPVQSYTSNDYFEIVCSDSLLPTARFKREIDLFVHQQGMSVGILKNQVNLKNISLEKVKTPGLFKIKNGDRKLAYKQNVKYVGFIAFYKPYILKDEAILVYEKSSSPKSGQVALLYLKKSNDKWETMEQRTIERW